MEKIYSTDKAIDNINRIMKEKEINQKEIPIITGMQQGNVSNILNKKKKNRDGKLSFFTVDQLVALSLAWGISIDKLLGIEKNSSKEKISPRDICKFLLKCENVNMHMGNHEILEYCYYLAKSSPLDDEYNFTEDRRKNKYICIYFSNWEQPKNRDEQEFYWNVGNENVNATKINQFLERLKQIKSMKHAGNLDEEMYNRLLESYLNDVPDK